MSSFDIKHMARGLLFPENQHPSFAETVATRMVETAVEIINAPHRTEDLLNAMTDAYEMDIGMSRVDDQIIGIVKRIRTQMHNDGWDPRVKIRLAERKLSNTYHQLRVCMDLDETIRSSLDSIRHQSRKHKEDTSIVEVVSDNPGAELINELDRELSRQSQHRTPLLSDRDAKFVASDKNGNGWG